MEMNCQEYENLATFDNEMDLFQLGGPSWTVQLGRRDSTTASLSTANSDIPAPTLNLSGIISSFSNKGFSANEMVALSGIYVPIQIRPLELLHAKEETKLKTV